MAWCNKSNETKVLLQMAISKFKSSDCEMCGFYLYLLSETCLTYRYISIYIDIEAFVLTFLSYPCACRAGESRFQCTNSMKFRGQVHCEDAPVSIFMDVRCWSSIVQPCSCPLNCIVKSLSCM